MNSKMQDKTTDNHKIAIMGIVNLTDDSYYAESRFLKDGRTDVGTAIAQCRKMIEEGASIIDVGACSSRPGSLPVGED